MQPSDLRVALFSGNYNYVRDGANQALNRLVDYLLRQGVQVRIYSPTVDNPAFKPTSMIFSCARTTSAASAAIAVIRDARARSRQVKTCF